MEVEEVREVGMEVRLKNHMEIPLSENSVAQTPPPAAANASPYDAGFELVTVHPSLLFAWNEQSVVLTRVEIWRGEDWVQPGSVCKLI